MPPPVPASGRVVFPLPQGTRVATSAFGMRVHPITGVTKLHPSADDDAPTAPPSLPPTTASSPPDNASATSTRRLLPRRPLRLRPHHRQARQPTMNIFPDISTLDDQI
ncbi:hypothetical protein HMPREF9594_02357 [Cutibacterium acnes HL005PA1]|nr:hypothetical protein HMPREF9574_01267 [Cutibacterium acnes HL074PA1]EFT27704.1 hypothetical protein HMPREF9594_02357 [Cutibacterium acnes HL005PA1]